MVIEPIKGWKIIGDVNYKMYHERLHAETLKVYNHDVNGEPYQETLGGANSSVSENYEGSKYLNLNAYTEYAHSFDAEHNFKIMVGVQSEQLWQDNTAASRLGIIVQGMNTIDTTNGMDSSGQSVPPTVGGAYNKWATAGYFGRLNYDQYFGKFLPKD